MERPFEWGVVCGNRSGTRLLAGRLFEMTTHAVRASYGAAVAWLFLATPAFACTLCHSEPALSVRARLMEPDLAWNVATILLPLTGLLAIVAWVAYEPKKQRAS